MNSDDDERAQKMRLKLGKYLFFVHNVGIDVDRLTGEESYGGRNT